MTPPFHYVYLLRDVATRKHFYVGQTHDLQLRLKWHNEGHVPYTAKHVPWEIHAAIAVRSKESSQRLERYLKTHAGREWVLRHLQD